MKFGSKNSFQKLRYQQKKLNFDVLQLQNLNFEHWIKI